MPPVLAEAAMRYDRWIDGPAALLGEIAGALHPGRRARLELAGDGRTIRVGESGRGGRSATTDISGESARSDLAGFVSGRTVTIEVPPSWTIERRLELPIEAAPHLDGIVASRLSALSPIPAADVLYGHHMFEVDRETRRIRLAVAILQKARLAPLLELVERAGSREVEVVAPLAGGEPVVLLPRRSGAGRRNGRARMVLTGLLLVSAVSAVAALAARPFIADAMDERRVVLERRADVARRVISDATMPLETATLPEQTALQLKNDAISALAALDDLAAALPLNAHATEIGLADGRIRLSGRTSDLPGVLTALESSGRFADSRLIGTALTRDDGVTSDFVIETRPLIRSGGALR